MVGTLTETGLLRRLCGEGMADARTGLDVAAFDP
jgi:hypothetical protein